MNHSLSSAEIDDYYADVKYERIAILNALGAFHTFLGKAEKAPQKEVHFKDATQYYNRASRIDETEPSMWIGKRLTTWEHAIKLKTAQFLLCRAKMWCQHMPPCFLAELACEKIPCLG